MKPYQQKEKVIRRWIITFIICLVLSGLTAFALETELGWLFRAWPIGKNGDLYAWVLKVYEALKDSNIRYPFLACVLVFPLAFIAGGIRGIPIYWRLIDCSFGLIGLVPLSICYRKIRWLEAEGR